MHQVVAHSQGRLAALLVWIHVLPGDGAGAAVGQSEALRDESLRHFYDPRRRVGKALAPGLGAGRAVVWDTYLYFPSGVQWDDLPPLPEDWAHQLGAAWADPARFRSKGGLLDWLRAGAADRQDLSER